MNNYLKIGLIGAGAYVIYKGYQLYRLSNEVTYKPIGFDYSNGTLNVKMQLTNPADISVNMKGIDGKILTSSNNVIATFSSGAFVINKGTSFFSLSFKVDYLSMGSELLNLLVSKSIPNLKMVLVKRLDLISTSETFDLTNLK